MKKVVVGGNVGQECLVHKRTPKEVKERRNVRFFSSFTETEGKLIMRAIKKEMTDPAEFVRRAIISRVMGGEGKK